MLQNLTGWHALIILAIVVLVFGAAKLPALARSVGQSMRILKSEVAESAPAEGASAAPGRADPAMPVTVSASRVDPARPALSPGE
ncbi:MULTISPECIES: twin-arginine translocase TatA/TatE family subunit [unclassified Microbacterium]|uniref:twin-arginine translocase TatA/TatE family subunit n=1 Tax=unclassified Microbacterium TaxID=2609290 RepID=UPI00343C14CF